MTGRRATHLSPGVLQLPPRGTTSYPGINFWNSRNSHITCTHCILLLLLLHAATEAKKTHQVLPVEVYLQTPHRVAASISAFSTRKDHRQHLFSPTPESSALSKLLPQSGSNTKTSEYHHNRQLDFILKISSNLPPWKEEIFRRYQFASKNLLENNLEHVKYTAATADKNVKGISRMVQPSKWERITRNTEGVNHSWSLGVDHITRDGLHHGNLKSDLVRHWYSVHDNRGEMKTNSALSEAMLEQLPVQTNKVARHPPKNPFFSNKKKEKSVGFCSKSSHVASITVNSYNSIENGAWLNDNVKEIHAIQTPVSDMKLMVFEDRGEDSKSSNVEENVGSSEWQGNDGEPLQAMAQEFSTDTKIIIRRWKRKTDVLEVQVVEGDLAVLPCNLAVDDPRDSVQLILWIKEGVHTPLYSYDYRELLGGQPKETKPDANSTLARRTSFRTDTTPAALLVERVDAEDAGVYRCRVDHLLSPTTNTRTNLTVIVPPSRARISWRLGNSGLMPVDTPLVGPFLEGAAPTLVCTNDDGWPPPAVVWYEGKEIIDDTYEVDSDIPFTGIVQNDLTLSILTRADLGRRLTCSASNTNTTKPATTTVTIDLTLSIVGVRVEEVKSAWAGEENEVECKVWGSRPPPSVVWWLGSTMLAPSHAKMQEEGNVTVSVLKFTPKAEDDGAMLICQATNEKLPDQAVQDSRLLSINYAPLVELRLGRSLDPERIKEGDDVYFECSVDAKPPISNVDWRHDGVKLLAGEGVFVSNMSLVVQRVTRSRGGVYTCEATNARATSSSPPLLLDVKYAPVCGRQEKTQHSVAKLENAEVSCRVEANPSKVTFRWTFNNTAEAIDVPDGRFVVVGTESRVNYTPMNELDYGTLLCWANNSIGVQSHPCVFHIVGAGKPNPPHNCRIFDVTISSLQVTCLPGDDGGLSQEFLLQVYQVGSMTPVVEMSQPSPSFSVTDLRPATAYKVTVTAVNYKGASRATQLKAYTGRLFELQKESSAADAIAHLPQEPVQDRKQGPEIRVVVSVAAGVAGVPLLVGIGVLMWLKVWRRISTPPSSPRRQSTLSKDAISTALSSEGSPHRDPDLLSHTTDSGNSLDNCDHIATISTSSSLFLNNVETSYPCSTHYTGDSQMADALAPVSSTFPTGCGQPEVDGRTAVERRHTCHYVDEESALQDTFPHLYKDVREPRHTHYGSLYCLSHSPNHHSGNSHLQSLQNTLQRGQKGKSGIDHHLCLMRESQPSNESNHDRGDNFHEGHRRPEGAGREGNYLGGIQHTSTTVVMTNKRESFA